jgi:hypothetical protein
MGYDLGSIFVYKERLWLFAGYAVKDFIEHYVLHGLHGEVLEVPSKECYFLLSPTEIDYEAIAQQMGE